MDETRRFLRYVVPALVFLAEVALLAPHDPKEISNQ